MFSDSLVDAFVMPAKDNNVFITNIMIHYLLVEQYAVRTGVENLIVVALRFKFINAAGNGLRAHKHPALSSIRSIVNSFVLVFRPVSEVVTMDFNNSFINGALDNRVAKWTVKHFRKEGDNIYSHNAAKVWILFSENWSKKKTAQGQSFLSIISLTYSAVSSVASSAAGASSVAAASASAS